jgi:hypothetical protein
MGKRTSVLYTAQVSGAPPRALGVISIAAGNMVSIRVPIGSSEGWINEVIVRQLTGTTVPFTVELLDSQLVYHQSSTQTQFQQAWNTAAAVTIDLYRIVDSVSGTAGNTAELRTAELGYSFINADQVTDTINQRYVYLTIIPNNTLGSTTWEATVTAMKDIP